MKKSLIAILILISFSATAQNYADSTITLQLPRCFSWWITKSISAGLTKSNFRMIDVLKPYVSDATKPDSLFTVTLPAKYVQAGLELITTRPVALALEDYIKVVYNQKLGATGAAIVGYTSLQSQIVTKANGATNQKLVATYLRDWFVNRTADFTNLYQEERNDVISLVNQ